MKRKVVRILLLIPVCAVIASILLVIAMKWVPVTRTPLMLKRAIASKEHVSPMVQWTPLEKISKNMVVAVIASEDQKFYSHNGFDFEELEKMMDTHSKKGKPVRGCSTISQQTAKNCFTWCTRTWARKALEAYYTVLIEFIWGKDRIMEVYLNIVELGPGIYGTEAAARHYFKSHASSLTLTDAATLACLLPNPLKRTPSWVNRRMTTHRDWIIVNAGKVQVSK